MPRGRVFGLRCTALLARYDPATASLRMCQLSLFEGGGRLLDRLPKSGMTVSGRLYQQPMWVRHTSGNESGLWPTPNAKEPMDKVKIEHYLKTGEMRYSPTGYKMPRRLMLAETVAAQMWPTPTQQDSRIGPLNIGGSQHRRDRGSIALADVVLFPEKYPRMWPTPASRDWKDGSAEACKNVPVNHLLGRAVHRWPTPQADDASNVFPKENRRETLVKKVGGGQLNPNWVEWLMGFPVGWTDLNA